MKTENEIIIFSAKQGQNQENFKNYEKIINEGENKLLMVLILIQKRVLFHCIKKLN